MLRCAAEGPRLDGEQAALDLIGDAMGHEATLVAVPVARVADEFFRLRSGVAGEVMQKFVNYRVRLAVVGDLSRQFADSSALRDFVHLFEWDSPVWEHDHDSGLRLLRLAVETHAITCHHALPLLLRRPGGLVVEMTDGTDDYNRANYRNSLFYDLAKSSVLRMAGCARR